jgi:hypothetical protein
MHGGAVEKMTSYSQLHSFAFRIDWTGNLPLPVTFRYEMEPVDRLEVSIFPDQYALTKPQAGNVPGLHVKANGVAEGIYPIDVVATAQLPTGETCTRRSTVVVDVCDSPLAQVGRTYFGFTRANGNVTRIDKSGRPGLLDPTRNKTFEPGTGIKTGPDGIGQVPLPQGNVTNSGMTFGPDTSLEWPASLTAFAGMANALDEVERVHAPWGGLGLFVGGGLLALGGAILTITGSPLPGLLMIGGGAAGMAAGWHMISTGANEAGRSVRGYLDECFRRAAQ